MKKILKNILYSLFESKKDLKKLEGLFSGKSLLIVGDGISGTLSHQVIDNYDYILTVNFSVYNKSISITDNRIHLVMESVFLFPKFLSDYRYCMVNSIRKKLYNFKFSNVFVSSLGRPFGLLNNVEAKYIYLSPYHKVKIENRVIWDDFTGAFHAALGLASLMSFNRIGLLGFDAWLLYPKNNVRWFSDISKPKDYDLYEREPFPDFLDSINNTSNLSVYTYNHYVSSHKQIHGISLGEINYIPSIDRKSLILDNDMKELNKCEVFANNQSYHQ